jgi:hypothetical protein
MRKKFKYIFKLWAEVHYLYGLILIPLFALGGISIFTGCTRQSVPVVPVGSHDPLYRFEATGEDFLINALEEVQAVADYSGGAGLPGKARRLISATETDTTFIYGEITSDGYGAVVTERHAHPKGMLLITVRKSHGKPEGKIVTETRRYISYADFLKDSTEQSNITEVYGLTSDTIVTHVLRNGTLETYTFRLPVVTRTLNPTTGAVRVTTRYGAAGAVFSEIRDGSGNLVQVRKTNGEADGALVTYTEYADASWRLVKSTGRADGSVFRDITSGP